MIKLKDLLDEGFLDRFKRKPSNKPTDKPTDKPGYGDSGFSKEWRGFSTDPESEMTDAGKENFKLQKEIDKYLGMYISNERHILEMLEQRYMVEKDKNDKYYLTEQRKWVKDLEEIDFKMTKGVW